MSLLIKSGFLLIAADNRPDPWADYDWSKPSRAVIACDSNGNGCILHYVGAHLDYDINGIGLTELDDLGLDNAPEGLSVWEGEHHVTRDYSGETDYWLKGEFRALTDAEQRAVGKNECPWDADGWEKR